MDIEAFEDMRDRVERRLKPSRYQHSLGVSQTAEQLARIYGVDQDEAAVAGLLHDWDKALSVKELRKKAKKLTDVPKFVRKQAPGVLHSFTAAASLRDEFPQLSDEVLQAIGRHTCGAADMSDLDMVIYVADMIEPRRSFEGVDELRECVGQVSLDELYFRTFKATFVYLVKNELPVYPDTLDIYNRMLAARAADQDAQ